MQPQAWTLYIDESGQFEDLGRSVIVAGLLIPSRAVAAAERARARLEKRIPWIDWPFHASLYNRLCFPAIVAAAWPDRTGLPEPAIGTAQYLRAACDASLTAVVSRLQTDGGLGDDDDLRDLERAVHSAREHFLAMSVLRDDTFVAMRDEWLELEALLPDGGPQPVLVAAGEGQDGDALATCLVFANSTHGNRYAGTLKCLFRRCADALALLDGDHVVDVEICGRGVGRRSGRRRWLDLRQEDVRAIAAEALGVAGTWIVGEVRVHDYDGDVLGGLVLADRAANVAARQTRGGASLGTVEAALRGECLPIRFDGRPPMLAAAGATQDWIDHAQGRAGQPAMRLDTPGIALWAIDQACEWLACVAPMGPR